MLHSPLVANQFGLLGKRPACCHRVTNVSLPSCRCVLTHTPSEGLPALQVVGRVLAEQAALFYATDAQVKSV